MVGKRRVWKSSQFVFLGKQRIWMPNDEKPLPMCKVANNKVGCFYFHLKCICVCRCLGTELIRKKWNTIRCINKNNHKALCCHRRRSAKEPAVCQPYATMQQTQNCKLEVDESKLKLIRDADSSTPIRFRTPLKINPNAFSPHNTSLNIRLQPIGLEMIRYWSKTSAGPVYRFPFFSSSRGILVCPVWLLNPVLSPPPSQRQSQFVSQTIP